MSVAPLRGADPDVPRIPPYNTEAEQALLGAIFRDARAYTAVAGFLEPEHFSIAVHGRIYAAICKLIDNGQVANPVTLKNQFDQDPTLADLGGAKYLVQIAAAAVTVINAEHYGRQILDLHVRRQLIGLSEDIADRAFRHDLDDTAGAQLAHAEEHLKRLGQTSIVSSPLPLTVASDLAGMPVPDRVWCVSEWLPLRQVTLLSGDGGTGKSLLAMQLQVATAVGGRWLGLPTMQCRSFGLYAEDDQDELHRRLARLADGAGVDLLDIGGMSWRSAVEDSVELVEIDDAGNLCPTAYFRQVEQAIRGFGARLVVLDAAANVFGADEVKRRHVNGFLILLRRLAASIDGAVLLLAHPSAAGLATGSGLSGSTHWNNAVRSRLYFTRATSDNADPDERWLQRLKANYSGAGDTLRVRWTDGAFAPIDEPSGIDRVAMSAKADRLFMELLVSTYASTSWVCPNLSARNYAPTVFSRHPERDGLGKPAFEAAMHRLLKTGAIKTETYGRPSEPRTRLAPS
jgi:RecA-family ATPase